MIDFKDFINALFELGGAIMAWLNVVKLRKDKAVSGVFWPTTLFFATWGFWNVIYYPALNQPLSAVAGAFLALANAVWVVLALKYMKKEKIISEQP